MIAAIYFPPVTLDGKSACLRMNFKSFEHFAVKLKYVHKRQYKERMLFRSLASSYNPQHRHLEADITSDMTEGQEFVVVLHAQSSSLGKMAVINSINLQMDECYKTGKYYVSNFIFGILSISKSYYMTLSAHYLAELLCQC